MNTKINATAVKIPIKKRVIQFFLNIHFDFNKTVHMLKLKFDVKYIFTCNKYILNTVKQLKANK